jgi:MFS family permease
LFYVLYVAFEVPYSIVMKKLHVGRMIPALMFCWSVVIIGTGFMKNASQLYASRLLLGFFESGMFPCLAVYLSTFYKREEQGLRIAYLLVSTALSGAFGGLFAFALLKMDGVAGLAGWRWLFIVEGCATVVVSVVIWFLLLDDFEAARFLNEDDKKIMRIRAEIARRYNGSEDFDWAEVWKAFEDPKLWISCFSQFMGDICSFGLSTFLPLIIKGFGYGTVKTQLLTIPVFLVAAVIFVLVSWISDQFGKRVAFMLPSVLVTAIGYAIQLGVPVKNRGVLYFSTFLIAPGIYIILGLNATWVLNSHAGYLKRATAMGSNQTIGNAAGLAVSLLPLTVCCVGL